MSLWRRLTAPFRAGPRRPLSTRQPQISDQEVPLGMEATDLDLVNKVNRRNQSLERSNATWKGSFAEATDRAVKKLKDDETYAKEYHRLYSKEK